MNIYKKNNERERERERERGPTTVLATLFVTLVVGRALGIYAMKPADFGSPRAVGYVHKTCRHSSAKYPLRNLF